MIYDPVAVEEPIRQGDIFLHVPRVEISVANLLLIEENEDQPKQGTWNEIQPSGQVTAIVPIKSVAGIVITQNCDAARSQYICLAQIDPFLEATGNAATPPANPKKWERLIVKHSRTSPRYFYLPPDDGVGFGEAMAADFRIMLRVSRVDLQTLTANHRRGRLKEVAADHFRESLGYFFRRYAFNEWYPLDRGQFQAYAEECGEQVEPYPWQTS